MIRERFRRLTNTGFLHILGSGFLNKIIAFTSSYILIRILPKVDYGVYSYAQNIINIFMIVNGFGIASGLLQILCENNRDEVLVKAYFRKCILFGCFFDVFIVLLIYIYSFFVDDSFGQLNGLLRFMMFIPLCDLFFDLIQVYYRGVGDNRSYSYISSMNSILIFLLSIIEALIWGCKD